MSSGSRLFATITTTSTTRVLHTVITIIHLFVNGIVLILRLRSSLLFAIDHDTPAAS